MTQMPVPPDHALHDPLLVAAHAAGDASGDDLGRAAALVSGCAECAALHRDLRALAAALGAAPAPRRPRDFRLPAAAAAPARPRGWRRLLAPLSGARSAAGPLAASLAALGVAGLLLGGGARLGPPGGGSRASLAGIAAPSAADETSAASPGAIEDPAFGAATDDPAPSVAASSGAVAPAPVDRGRAIEIARTARIAYADAPVLEASIGRFDVLGNPGVDTSGPPPAPDELVWAVNLGRDVGSHGAAGAIVVIDVRDGHVIQTFDWIA